MFRNGGPEEEQFDENEAGLLGRKSNFAPGFNDPEDDEADRIYAEIDEKMGERRRSRREKQEEAAERRQEASQPKTQLIFADLKRDLSRVSEAEWAALPEVGDFRIKRMKRSGAIENPRERFLPVPDSIQSSFIINQTVTAGTIVAAAEGEEADDFTKIGEARGKLLGMHLDQISKINGAEEDNATFLTEGIGAIASNEKLAQIGDLKRARQLFASIIKTNRKNASGWISAARLELQAGNQKQARALIVKGCGECSKSEEIWREAVSMHEGSASREILAKALKNVPESVLLWILAAERESDLSGKRKILRAALERNATSSKLWTALVELEDSEEDARLLLARAVECAPDSVELWLALAKLQESTEQARQVLNRARLTCPKSFAVWINAARLEEANDTPAAEIKKLLTRGAADLTAQGVTLSLSDWQREAEECEAGGDLLCATELVAIGVDLAISVDSNVIESILDYARGTEHVACSKSALQAILMKKKDCREAVLLLIEKIKSFDDYDRTELHVIYETVLSGGTSSSDLWIKYARDFLEESRDILSRASEILTEESDQIKIWKEAINLEMSNFRSKPELLEEFTPKLPCYPELMIEMVRVYKALGMRERANELARDGISKFPKEAEFWICASSLEFDDKGLADVSLLKKGLEVNPTSVKLALKIAEVCDDFNSVQVLLEKTRVAIQKSKVPVLGYDKLLVALCLLLIPRGHNTSVLPPEFCPHPVIKCTGSGNLSGARLLLNQSLKELPRSGLLWHLAVSMEPRQLRRSKVTEALRRLETGTGENSDKDESLLRWTLAMILEDKTAKESELIKAKQLDPFNMDLMAFLNEPIVTEEFSDTSGPNWIKFIEQNSFYFDRIDETFLKFIQNKK